MVVVGKSHFSSLPFRAVRYGVGPGGPGCPRPIAINDVPVTEIVIFLFWRRSGG